MQARHRLFFLVRLILLGLSWSGPKARGVCSEMYGGGASANKVPPKLPTYLPTYVVAFGIRSISRLDFPSPTRGKAFPRHCFLLLGVDYGWLSTPDL